LTLATFTGTVVTSAVAPNPPGVNQPANLVVNVSNRAVDGQGIGRAQPVAGVSVQLTGTGSWRLTSPNPATTDGGGQATWQITCQTGGTQPVAVSVNGAPAQALDVPACV
jgi:hypothetical protein